MVNQVFAHHSIQHTLSGGFPGIQRHASLLQQLLVHHLNFGFCLYAFLQTMEALFRGQLEGVDLGCGHVQYVDDLDKNRKREKYVTYYSGSDLSGNVWYSRKDVFISTNFLPC